MAGCRDKAKQAITLRFAYVYYFPQSSGLLFSGHRVQIYFSFLFIQRRIRLSNEAFNIPVCKSCNKNAIGRKAHFQNYDIGHNNGQKCFFSTPESDHNLITLVFGHHSPLRLEGLPALIVACTLTCSAS